MSIRPASRALEVRRTGLRRRGPVEIVVPLTEQQRRARRQAADRRTAILAAGLEFHLRMTQHGAEVRLEDTRSPWRRWWAGARARWLAFWGIRPDVIRVRAAIARPLLWARVQWYQARWLLREKSRRWRRR